MQGQQNRACKIMVLALYLCTCRG